MHQVQRIGGSKNFQAFFREAASAATSNKNISLNQAQCADFKWLLREELWEALTPDMRKALFAVLYDEE